MGWRRRQTRCHAPPPKHTGLVTALRADSPAGCCPYCDRLLTAQGPGRPRGMCGDEECRRNYRRDYEAQYYADVRRAQRQAARP